MIKNKYIIRLSFLCLFITIIASIFLYRYFIIQSIGARLIGDIHSKIVRGYKAQILDYNVEELQKLEQESGKNLQGDQQFNKFIAESTIYFKNIGNIVNIYDTSLYNILGKEASQIKILSTVPKLNIYHFIFSKIDQYFLGSIMDQKAALNNAFYGIASHVVIPCCNIINEDGSKQKASFIVSYIPIWHDLKIVAVIEIYSDFTSQWKDIDSITKENLITFLSIVLIFFIIIMRNTKFAQKVISEQSKTNRALKDAKIRAESESSAKTEFLANVSHELRTPLNAIIGFSEMLINENYNKISTRQHKEYIEDINNSGKHLLSVINDILDFSKASMDELKVENLEIDLKKLVSSSLRFIKPRAEQAGIKLIEELPSELVVINADPKRLKQALLNLLSNSVKFTPKNGSITLKVIKDYNLVYIYVKDTGIGMDEKDIPKALSSFGQIDNKLNRKYEGTGLGLPLTKKLVELMHGKFKLCSTIGTGTTVILTFEYVDLQE